MYKEGFYPSKISQYFAPHLAVVAPVLRVA